MSAPLARFAKTARYLAALALVISSISANAQDWGATATISSTMGVFDGRVCTGEASRGDIGCATNAPYVSRTTGYLGLGTSQPTAAVHVLGAGQVRLYDVGAADIYRPVDAGNAIFQLWSDAGGTPWSSIFRVASDGRTAINFRNPSNSTPLPSTTLHIGGSIRFAAETSTTLNTCDANRTGSIKFESSQFYVCRNGSSWETLAAAAGGGASGDRIISGTTQAIAYQNTSLSLVTNNVERMVIGTNGNIGINQQPAANTDLGVSASNILFTNTANTPSGSIALNLQATGSTGAGFSVYGSNFSSNYADPRAVEIAAFGGTTALQFRTSQNAHDIPFLFKMGSSNIKEVARITSTGLAIGGITTPTTAIDVSGTTTTTSLRLRELTGSQPSGFQGGIWMTSGTTAYYNAGLVGIGTASPGYPLDVTGAINTQSRYRISGTAALSLDPADINKLQVGSQAGGQYVAIQSGDVDDALVVATNGYVGIGTTTPHSNLTIRTNNWPNIAIITTVADQDSKIQLAHNTSAPDDGWTIRRDGDMSDQFQLRYNNASRLRLTTAGVLTILGTSTCTIGNGTGATSCTSDKRLKTDIHPLQNSLEKIVAMQGVHFKWKTDTSTTRVGLIAQDVEKVFPEIVTTDTNTGMKMVDYASLVAPLIESVKTLDAKNKALEAKNADLETRLQRLEKLMTKPATDK